MEAKKQIKRSSEGFSMLVLDICEQIEKGVKYQRIPFGLFVMSISNILYGVKLGEYKDDPNDNLEFMYYLLESIYGAEKNGLIDHDKTLSALIKLNNKFPDLSDNK